MAFASKVTYVGDGVTFQYTITFPYISFSHVKVFVNGVLQLTPLNYQQVGPGIRFTNIPEVNDAIEIERQTSPVNTLVDFVDGATLRADDLDTAYLHNFYLGQEYADNFNVLITETLYNIGTGAGIVLTETDEILAAMVNEMLNLEAADTIQQRVTDIDNNAEAILTLGESLQVQINTLAGGTAATMYLDDEPPVPGAGSYPDPIIDGARWYDTNDNNTGYIYQSGAWLSLEDPRVGQAAADITILQADLENSYAAIVAEQFVQANQNFATASSLAVLGAQNADGSAFIIDLDSVKIDSDTGVSLATRFSQIDSSVGDNTASITTESTTRADADTATASTISLIGAENGTQTAFILNDDTVKIGGDTGPTFASKFSTLAAADNDNFASIWRVENIYLPAVEDDVTAIQAEYGVDISVNGYVSGFRLINGGTPGSTSFIILADKFAVVDPSGDPGETPYIPFQISGGKVRFNADVEIDGDLMITGSLNGTALINGTIGTTQIGANAITTTQLNADSVTTNKIAANAVTATEINVTNLQAVSTSTGILSVDGAITVGTTGHIKGGQTAYDTGTGFFLGYSGAAHKFSIGNSTDFITWDGSSLVVRGNVSVGNYDASTTEVLLAANTQRLSTSEFSFNEVKKFEVNRPGTVRVYYDRRMSSVTGGVVQVCSARVKADGVIVGGTDTYTNTTYASNNVLVTLTNESFITIEHQSGERDTVEPVESKSYLQNAQVRATKSDGESVVTD